MWDGEREIVCVCVRERERERERENGTAKLDLGRFGSPIFYLKF